MSYYTTSNFLMILSPDCDQFYIIQYFGGYWLVKNSIDTTRQFKFVPRELFNMVNLQIIYFHYDKSDKNIVNTVPPHLRKNLRNINYNSLSENFNDTYINMLINYLNGNNFVWNFVK